MGGRRDRRTLRVTSRVVFPEPIRRVRRRGFHLPITPHFVYLQTSTTTGHPDTPSPSLLTLFLRKVHLTHLSGDVLPRLGLSRRHALLDGFLDVEDYGISEHHESLDLTTAQVVGGRKKSPSLTCLDVLNYAFISISLTFTEPCFMQA